MIGRAGLLYIVNLVLCVVLTIPVSLFFIYFLNFFWVSKGWIENCFHSLMLELCVFSSFMVTVTTF